MRPIHPGLFLVFVLLLNLAACNGPAPEGLTALPPGVALTPYHTAVSTHTAQVLPGVSVTPSHTAEPVIYTVVSGDSLSSIAFRFGVDLNELMLVNPGVNANAMSIGTKLIIPLVGDVSGTPSIGISGLPTPIVTSIIKPDCYRMDDDQWICFLLVHNDLNINIGNLIGQVLPADLAAGFTATCPLDLLPAGASAPLVTFIQSPELNLAGLEGRLISAIPVSDSASRYRSVQIASQDFVLSDDRRSALINAELTPTAGGIVRVLAYAQDAQKRVLGYRIWESSAVVPTGTRQSLQLFIYSLGGAISEIHLVAQVTLE
jgi:LysM repeat protein